MKDPMMSESRNRNIMATALDEWPFAELAARQRAFSRLQKQRFHDYIEEHNPALAAAFSEEEARFVAVSRDVIEPAMKEVAEEARRQGYYVSIAVDNFLDRPTLFGTSAIRLYCSRQALLESKSNLVSSPSFIVCYGCVQTSTLGFHVVFSEIDTESPRSLDQPNLAYPDCNLIVIRARLLEFLGGLQPDSVDSAAH